MNIELIVNLNLEKQGREEDVDHKNVCALELRRLKRISNIKSFQAFSFTFTALNGICYSRERCDFRKSMVGMDKSPVFGERNLISSGVCLD